MPSFLARKLNDRAVIVRPRHFLETEFFGDQRYAIKKGDVLGAPAGGPETAHQIINTGSTPLIYLGLSTKAKTEICEYPDSGKFLAKTNRDGSSFDHIGRGENALDYWDGEPGF